MFRAPRFRLPRPVRPDDPHVIFGVHLLVLGASSGKGALPISRIVAAIALAVPLLDGMFDDLSESLVALLLCDLRSGGVFVIGILFNPKG